MLSFLRAEGTLILYTDASDVANGAVPSQKQDNRQQNVIEYFSRSLDRTRQYCIIKRELLAVVKSLAHLHPFLYGRKFIVRTDHSSIRWLMNWWKIQQYDLKIEHRPGKCYLNADALSRRPCLEERCKSWDRAESKYRTTTKD